MIDPSQIDPQLLSTIQQALFAQQQPDAAPTAPAPVAAPTMAQGGLGGLLSRIGLPGLGQGLGKVGSSIRNTLNPVDPNSGIDPQFAQAQQRSALIRLGAGIAGGKGLGQGLSQGLDASSGQFQSAMENAYNNNLKKKQAEQQALAYQNQLAEQKQRHDEWQAGHDIATEHLKIAQAQEAKPKIQIKSEPLESDATKVQDYLVNLEDGTKKPLGNPYASPNSLKIGAASLSPEQNEALYGPTGAVTLGKLDPYKINSKTASILANAYISNPGINMNALGATANLQRNPSFQQKAMTAETMPEILTGVAEAGKKLNFSDVKFAGEVDKWLKGQSNNPDLINYMTRRNDALFGIASVMRGNGVTDKAYQAEEEAAHPTMSPRAIEAWLSAQMASLAPRLKKYRDVTGNGSTPIASDSQPDLSAAADAELKRRGLK